MTLLFCNALAFSLSNNPCQPSRCVPLMALIVTGMSHTGVNTKGAKLITERSKPNVIIRSQHTPTPAEETARQWLADGVPVRVAVTDDGLVIVTEYGKVLIEGRMVWRVENQITT